jgi:phage terminase large subunit-like protein
MNKEELTPEEIAVSLMSNQSISPPLLESGNVYLPENAQWLQEYLE